MSNSIIEISGDGLIAATTCPAKYWFYRCSKSIKKQYTTNEIIFYCLRTGIRKYYRLWTDSNVQPDITDLNKIISQIYATEYKNQPSFDKVMERTCQLTKAFITNHPVGMKPRLIGAKFHTPFPSSQPVYMLSDIIDATISDYKEREFLIAVSYNHIRDSYNLQRTLAYLGYQILRSGAVPYNILTFNLSGSWVQDSVDENDIQELHQACELTQFLHISKNTARHTGLACKYCGYLNVCKNNSSLRNVNST